MIWFKCLYFAIICKYTLFSDINSERSKNNERALIDFTTRAQKFSDERSHKNLHLGLYSELRLSFELEADLERIWKGGEMNFLTGVDERQKGHHRRGDALWESVFMTDY